MEQKVEIAPWLNLTIKIINLIHNFLQRVANGVCSAEELGNKLKGEIQYSIDLYKEKQ